MMDQKSVDLLKHIALGEDSVLEHRFSYQL